ncbi:hypothetical protein PYR72_41650 [Streptomyces sp. VNUA24]|nr:hypothetical protein [Streptomyces sp. VNUA24]WEH19835.1 hypothetical protein PYR72_41650 [Streptomyces sp. VNUA24]
MDQLSRALEAAWRQLADRLAEAGDEAKVEIVVPDGCGRAKLPVDRLGSLVALLVGESCDVGPST